MAEAATEGLAELSREVAGLPTELDPENEEAKRFDLLVLNLQLVILRSEPGFEKLRGRVRDIVGLLAEKYAIPMVREQMPLIQDVTVAMLETMRRRLRGLMQLIDKRQRKAVYTDFEDRIGDETAFPLPGFAVGTDVTRFRAKVQAFLREHLDHVAVAKLRTNRPLTASDVSELERLLGASGAGGPDDIRRAADNAQASVCWFDRSWGWTGRPQRTLWRDSHKERR